MKVRSKIPVNLHNKGGGLPHLPANHSEDDLVVHFVFGLGLELGLRLGLELGLD
jgi:hypothetical protein